MSRAIFVVVFITAVHVHAQPSDEEEPSSEADIEPKAEREQVPAEPSDEPSSKEPSDEQPPSITLPEESPSLKSHADEGESEPLLKSHLNEGGARTGVENSALPANVPVDEEGVFLGKDHTGTPEKPLLQSKPPDESQTWSEHYDGRSSESLSSEEVLIWIPRILLFPAHLVLEYLVRYPIVGLVTVAEENYIFDRVVDFFIFADGDGAIYPSAFYDAGRGFWVAGNFFYKNAWVQGHTIDAFAGYGTSGWFDITLGDRWTVFENNTGELSFTGTFAEDPTLAFTGIGPDTAIEDEVFFSQRKGEAIANLRVAFEGLNRLGIRIGYRNSELSGGRTPSIESSSSIFYTEDIPGFGEDYNLSTSGLYFELDSRSPERDFTAGSGLRLEGFGDFCFSMDGSKLQFFRYGARPAAFWDISGTNHVLILSLYAEAISPIGDDPLPISELISLGGENYLRGFVLGRFRGQSALVHSLVYTWPVLIFLDGLLFTELGTAFDGFYDDFSYDKMVLDWGFGLRTNLSREFGFNILFAFGTNQVELWDEDFEVDKFRFALGATRAF